MMSPASISSGSRDRPNTLSIVPNVTVEIEIGGRGRHPPASAPLSLSVSGTLKLRGWPAFGRA